MPAPTIDAAFVTQFEAEVHLAYQRSGMGLRAMTRQKVGVKNKTTFQKLGKGQASGKTRHGVVPAMNLNHDNVECTTVDRYAAEWIDKLDELRIQHDERAAVQDTIVMALRREEDDQIRDAMATSTNTHNAGVEITISDTSEPLEIMETLGEANVPFDGQIYAVVPWQMWSDMLDVPEFSDADYVGMDGLTFPAGTTAKTWLGIYWFPMAEQPVDGGGDKRFFVWHRRAVGHAIGADVSVDITWHGDHAAHFVNGMLQMGACLIDEEGVINGSYDTTP